MTLYDDFRFPLAARGPSTLCSGDYDENVYYGTHANGGSVTGRRLAIHKGTPARWVELGDVRARSASPRSDLAPVRSPAAATVDRVGTMHEG